MPTHYVVLGAGMQGTAAAYDLAHFAAPGRLVLADASLEQAQRSASRVNHLIGRNVAEPAQANALDPGSLGPLLVEADVLLSCVPYWMHPKIARVAIETGTNMLDLGGNTDVTQETLGLDPLARERGITLVPDTGLAPGLVNSIGGYLVDSFDVCETVRLYCGVLPQHPVPPFNYKLTFNVEGLVTEYDYQAVVLREGEVTLVDTLDELEDIRIEELGPMEAFTTSGGTSTAPYTYQGRVRNYEYKTIRYPGHCGLMRIFKDFGFWCEDEVDVRGTRVRPKDVFCRVFGESLGRIQDLDLCAIRGVGIGSRGGEGVRMQVDIFDRQCQATGFTSMERLTGFSMSIVAQEVAAGRVSKGAVRYENAMPGKRFLEELGRRGIAIRHSEERLIATWRG